MQAEQATPGSGTDGRPGMVRESAASLLARSQAVAAQAQDNLDRTRRHVAEMQRLIAGVNGRASSAVGSAVARDRPGAAATAPRSPGSRAGSDRRADEALAAFEQRCVAGVPRRAPDRILSLLEAFAGLDRLVKVRLEELVDACRAEGATWGEIGTALHVSRQAAHERFARRRPPA